MIISPPTSRELLLERANALSGKTLQQIALESGVNVPESTRHAKGWTGTLIEKVLGANASSAPEPDFVDLGIELKTIPLNHQGKPNESTYICVAQLEPNALKSWDTSLVKHKLTEVLWVPVEGTKTIPLAMRRIGAPLLWQPSSKQEKQLRIDWQELSDLIVMGKLEQTSAHMGKYLQIRPKAANAASLTRDRNQTDENNATLPRGFYLRPSFTASIFSEKTSAS